MKRKLPVCPVPFFVVPSPTAVVILPQWRCMNFHRSLPLCVQKSTPRLVFAKFCNMSEELMENFQGIHASVITALRCSKTRVWNSAGPQIFNLTPELHTRNSAGLRTLDWTAITWQNSRPGIPPDSRTLIPKSAGLQNSEPGIHRNPEFRVSATRNSGGLQPESRPDLEFH